MAETIGMAGAAVAGVAMVAWGVSKLFFDHKFHVLHVDGLDSNQREKAAAGCIIRDKHGELVSAGAYNLDHCYPPCHIGIAEATALKKGLELAQELKIKLDLIKVDNEEVYDRVLGQDPRPPQLPEMIEVIEDIRNILDELLIDPQKQLERIPRDDNQVARALANVGRHLSNNQGRKIYYKGSSDIPHQVTNLINMEKINWRLP